MDLAGVTHVHHFFLPRARQALAALWRGANSHSDPRIRHMLLFFVEQAIWGMSILNRYQPTTWSTILRSIVSSPAFTTCRFSNLRGFA